MLAVCKREWKAYMCNLYGLAFIAVLLCVVNALIAHSIIENRLPGIEYALYWGSYVLIAAVPLLSMRSMAEDRKNGTALMYRALPIRPATVVLGKYLALLAVLAVPTVIFAVTIWILGIFAPVEYGGAYLSLLFFFLVSAALAALCQFISSLTKHPLAAGGIGILVSLVLCLLSHLSHILPDGVLVTVLENISPIYHMQDVWQYGIFNLRSLCVLLLYPVLFVFLTVLVSGGCQPRPVAVGACLLAVVLGANVALPFLSFTVTEYGTDRQNLVEVPIETREFLESVDEDITIYWFCEDGEIKEDSLLDDWFLRLLDRYTELNPHVTVEMVTEAEEIKAWESYGLYNYDMIIKSEDRLKVVSSGELFAYSNEYLNQAEYSGQEVWLTYTDMMWAMSSYAYQGMDISPYLYIPACIANNTLTAAMDYVTTDEIPRPYILTGYEGASLPDGLKAALEDYDPKDLTELDLREVDAIPADASCVLLYGPTADLGERETAMLEAYLSAGGSLVLTTSPSLWTTGAPNLQSLLTPYGVSALSGIVFESTSGYYTSSKDTLVPQVNQGSDLYVIYSSDQNHRMPWSHAIAVSQSAAVTPIFVTSTAAVRKPAGGTSETLGDPTQYRVAVQANRVEGSGSASQIIWFGSTDAFTDSVAAKATANYGYLLESIELLRGDYTSAYTSIEGVSLLTEPMKEMGTAQSGVFVMAFAVIFPLVFLVGGAVICLKRRRRM